MAREVKIVVKDLHFPECPRWHDGRLWFVDFYSSCIISIAEDGSDRRIEVKVRGQPAGLGWLPDGRLLCVSSMYNMNLPNRNSYQMKVGVNSLLRQIPNNSLSERS